MMGALRGGGGGASREVTQYRSAKPGATQVTAWAPLSCGPWSPRDSRPRLSPERLPTRRQWGRWAAGPWPLR